MGLPGQRNPCIARTLLLLSIVTASTARVGDKVLAAAAYANTGGSERLARSSTTPELLVADLTVTASSSNGAAEVEIAATLSSGYKPATFTLEATDHLPGNTDASSAKRFSLGESSEPARVLRSPQLPQQQQGVTKDLSSSSPPTATSTVSTHDGSGAAVPAGSTGSIVSSSTSTSTGSGTQSQPQGSSNPSSLTSGSTIVNTNPNSSSSGDIQVLAQSSKQVINIIADSSSSSSSSSSAGASSSNTNHDIINVLALDAQQAPNPGQPTTAQQEVVGYRGPDWACIKKPGCKPSQQQFGSGGLISLLPGGSGECEFFGGCDAVKAQGACRASWMWEVDAELGAVVQWCGEQCACPGEAS